MIIIDINCILFPIFCSAIKAMISSMSQNEEDMV